MFMLSNLKRSIHLCATLAVLSPGQREKKRGFCYFATDQYVHPFARDSMGTKQCYIPTPYVNELCLNSAISQEGNAICKAAISKAVISICSRPEPAIV